MTYKVSSEEKLFQAGKKQQSIGIKSFHSNISYSLEYEKTASVNYLLQQGGSHLNLCKVFFILIFNEFYLFAQWLLIAKKLGRAVTFMKYLARVVSLIFLLKTLIWNKTMFRPSNSLNLAELMVN